MAEGYERSGEEYLIGRPRSYPSEWYSKLASLTPFHSLACDFGTGNGQAALGIAEHYEKVIGIDASEDQLKHGIQHDRIQYLYAPASLSEDEMVKLIGNENSVDLIISAEAVHWFDLPRFYSVANRLLRKPGGIIAVWVYYHMSVNPEFDAVMNSFTESTLPYWNEQVKEYVLNGYKTLPFPFESVGLGCEGEPVMLEMRKEFSLEGIFRYLRSMSHVHVAKKKGVDLVSEKVVKQFKDAWGGDDQLKKSVVYQAFMLAGKVKVV